jgi:hypothetical protein
MWWNRFIGQGRPQPPKIDLTATDVECLLKEIQKTTAIECADRSKWARHWGSASVVLAILSALGSGAAGVTVASLMTLTTTEKTIVVLLSFAGAAIGGFAAAVGAPNQAKISSAKADELASLERWVSLAVAEKLKPEAAQVRLGELVTWRD